MLLDDSGSSTTKLAADDGTAVDPNLALQTQQQQAAPTTSTGAPAPIPPPPALPSPTPAPTSPTDTTARAQIAAPTSPSTSPTTAYPTSPTALPSPTAPAPTAAPTTANPDEAVPSPMSLADPTTSTAAPGGTTSTAAPAGGTTSTLPAGFTLGQAGGADWGSAYYNGSRANGLVANSQSPTGYAISLDNGQEIMGATPEQWKQLEDAENANYQTPQAATYRMEQAGETSTSPTMKALLTNPEYQQLVTSQQPDANGNKSVVSLYQQMSPELQKLFQATPIYGQVYSELQQSGINGPAPTSMPGTAPATTQPTGPARYLQNGLETYADGTPVPGGYNALTDYYRQAGTTPGVVNPQVLQLIKANPALIGTLPPDQQASVNATLKSMGISLPSSGAAAAAGGAVTPMQLATKAPLGSSGAGAAAGGAGGAKYSPGDVGLGATILPNADPRLQGIQSLVDAAGGDLAKVDRTKLAQSMFDNFAASTAPEYQAALRSATQRGAAGGLIGSGQLRTSYGNLANLRDQQLQQAQTGFMNDALNGSIQDAFNKYSALMGGENQQFGEQTTNNQQLDEQQQFQKALSDTAFQQALAQWEQQQQAQQQQFNNGVTLTNLGTEQSPAALYESLAKQGLITQDELTKLLSGLGTASGSNATH